MSSILNTWCKWPTHWKRPWCWEGLKAGGEGDDRGQDSWIAPPTQWVWVWTSSGKWWRTGKPAVLQSMGLPRVGHDWATEQRQQPTEKQGQTEMYHFIYSPLLSSNILSFLVTLWQGILNPLFPSSWHLVYLSFFIQGVLNILNKTCILLQGSLHS